MLALLFDELSFTYLYDGTSVRAEYPAIRSFASTATSYLAVSSPGPDTLNSMPGYLTVRRNLHIAVEPTRIVDITPSGSTAVSATERDGLFAMARSLGYGTEMAGYYFPYCALLGNLVDRCRSFSFYSISPVREGFSPLNPILTTFDPVATTVPTRPSQKCPVRRPAAAYGRGDTCVCRTAVGAVTRCVSLRALQRAAFSFRVYCRWV